VSTRRRIASLFRELADAFDDLEQETRRRSRRSRPVAPEYPPVDPDVVRRVDRGIRKAGIRT
jgi:hypothetical protein